MTDNIINFGEFLSKKMEKTIDEKMPIFKTEGELDAYHLGIKHMYDAMNEKPQPGDPVITFERLD